MSKKSKAKSKKHTCKNHPTKIARGRCSLCKKWICRDCALLDQGKFLCKDTCVKDEKDQQPIEEVSPVDSVVEKVSTSSSKRTSSTLFLIWAALTFGACGITLSLISIRKSQDVLLAVQTLEQRQIKLIDILKTKNDQIKTLQKIVLDEKRRNKTEDTVKTEKKRDAGLKKKRVYKGRVFNYSPLKLPVSFDNGSTKKRLIALTFDGGSHKNATLQILDTLASRNVKATLFLTGYFIKRNVNLTKRFLAEGHEVGNHTYSHPQLTTWRTDHTHTTLPEISETMIATELSKANTQFKQVIGQDMLPLWRAPYGERNREICLWAQKYGYLHIGWKQAHTWKYNTDTNDWIPDEETPGYHSPEEVLEKFLTMADAQPFGLNGAIILMHLGTTRTNANQQVHLILGVLIDQLREKGYGFVKVSQMLAESGVDLSLLKRDNESAPFQQ